MGGWEWMESLFLSKGQVGSWLIPKEAVKSLGSFWCPTGHTNEKGAQEDTMAASPWGVHIILLHGCIAEIQDVDFEEWRMCSLGQKLWQRMRLKAKPFSLWSKRSFKLRKTVVFKQSSFLITSFCDLSLSNVMFPDLKKCVFEFEFEFYNFLYIFFWKQTNYKYQSVACSFQWSSKTLAAHYSMIIVHLEIH